MKQRQADYDTRVNAARSAAVRIEEARKSIEQAELRVQGATVSMVAGKDELSLKENALAALMHDRKMRYGDRDPDSEEKTLRATSEKADSDYADIKNAKAGLDQAVDNSKQEVIKANAVLKEAENNLTAATVAAAAKWQAAGFADENACRAARWTDPEISRTCLLLKDLETAAIELKTKRERNDAALAIEQARALTERSSAELTSEIESRQVLLVAAGRELNDLDFKVRTDDTNRESLAKRGQPWNSRRPFLSGGRK